MKETMNVHKALAELKLLDARITKETISPKKFVGAAKTSSANVDGIPIKDFETQAEAQYKSIISMINRRSAIKSAVMKSNAVTVVEIGGVQYTVAEAISMKNDGMEYISSLVNVLQNQLASAQMTANRENGDKLDQRADAYVKSLYENADMKNLSDDVKKVREEFIASQTVKMIDPINAAKTIQELTAKADAFLADVDSALSVSNALTTIEIEYETI